MPKTIGSIKVSKAGRILQLCPGDLGQGYGFKDWEAFYHHIDKPCYAGEYSEIGDQAWTRKSLLELAEGNEKVAKYLFETVDWQCPSLELEESLKDGFIIRCEECGGLYIPDVHKIPGSNRLVNTPCENCGWLDDESFIDTILAPIEKAAGTIDYQMILRVFDENDIPLTRKNLIDVTRGLQEELSVRSTELCHQILSTRITLVIENMSTTKE